MRPRYLLPLALLAVTPARAADLFVTSTADDGPGSLREALDLANTSLGPDDVRFAIPTSDLGFDGLWWTISLASPLPALTDGGTRILGFTQTASAGDTNMGTVGSGGTVGASAVVLPLVDRPEIAIDANGLPALVIDALASDILIEGLAIHDATTGVDALGLLAPGAAGRNRIVRAMLVGVLPDGSEPPRAERNRNSGIAVRTSIPGLEATELSVMECFVGYNGNVGILGEPGRTAVFVTSSEAFGNGWRTNDHDGIDLNGAGGFVRFSLSRDNLNLAMQPAAGSGHGIELGSQEAPGTGGNIVEENTIRNNISAGVGIRGGSSDNLVVGNLIIGNAVGISVADATSQRNRFDANTLIGNQGLGIDLHAGVSPAPFDGVTGNDPGDADGGPNGLQNAPVLVSAEVRGADTMYFVEMVSTSTAPFDIALYESGACDPSGYGEAELHLATLSVAGGFLGFAGRRVAYGRFLTATATDLDGNTSELSACREIVNEPPIAACRSVEVNAVTGCSADATIDAGSMDPNGDAIVLEASPAGPYPIGARRVTLTVTDDAGASGSCTATVSVTERGGPSLSCPDPPVTIAFSGEGAPVTFAASATDACDAAPAVVCDRSPGETFPVGSTAVSCTATDASGNTSTCSFEVEVVRAMADLSIEILGDLGDSANGEEIAVVVRVVNAGPEDAIGARVSGCVAAVESTCVPADLAGGIDLSAGASTMLELRGVVKPLEGEAVHTITVDAPASVIDPDLSNNTARGTTNVVAEGCRCTEARAHGSMVHALSLAFVLLVARRVRRAEIRMAKGVNA